MTDKEQIKLHKQLVKLLAPDYVDEAFLILTNCSEKWLTSFREELKKKSGNTACLAIEFAAMQLIRDKFATPLTHFGYDGWDDVLTKEDIEKL